jgi:hypothetical protein
MARLAAGRMGEVALADAKSSGTAPLTPSHAKAFAEVDSSGATVVGQGKPGFAGGTENGPTSVKVVSASCTAMSQG